MGLSLMTASAAEPITEAPPLEMVRTYPAGSLHEAGEPLTRHRSDVWSSSTSTGNHKMMGSRFVGYLRSLSCGFQDHSHLREQVKRAPSEATDRNAEICRHRLVLLLHAIRNGQEVDQNLLNERFDNVLHYKNRALTGTVFHYALWHAMVADEGADVVRCLLEARACLYSTASYVRDSRKKNSLEAIHIAAGLGSVPVLRELRDWATQKLNTNGVGLLNRFCHLTGSGEPGQKFYVPLHDAAYCGKQDAVIWLLENRAEPSTPNIDGFTPLHWLAKKGLDTGSVADLEAMVRALVKHKARLDDDSMGNIPLELAAAEESLYPRRLLHLLAPSFQMARAGDADAGGDRIQKHSIFEDMCLLSYLNTDAAILLAQKVREAGEGMRRKVQEDAQNENCVDQLASLFHMAPEAAAIMLELLMVRPVVQDSGHHPIRTRASLWGLFGTLRMRSDYQADTKRKDNMNWPEWRYDPSRKSLEDQPELAWHTRLVRKAAEMETRREYIEDVDTKCCLLPNILDIDIFMALACTKDESRNVFKTLPVIGAIQCMWDHLLTQVIGLRILLRLVEILTQALWGMMGTTGRSLAHFPAFWAIIFAGWVRDIVNLAYWLHSYYNKSLEHRNTFREWEQENSSSNPLRRSVSTLSDADVPVDNPVCHTPSSSGGSRKRRVRPPALHALWCRRNFIIINRRATGFVIVSSVLRGAFLWKSRKLQEGEQFDDTEQALLMLSTLVEVFSSLNLLRLTSLGKKINTILAAIFSGAIGELFLLTLVFCFATFMAFSMLKRNQPASAVVIYVYRGLLFGDGEALEYMGLDAKDFQESFSIRGSVMLLLTLVFHIVLLNLTTAVYSAEYERLEKDEEQHFQRERASFCCEAILSLQKLRLQGEEDAWKLRWTKGVTYFVGTVATALLFGEAFLEPPLRPSPQVAAMQAGILLVICEVGMQAIAMETPWFPHRQDGTEGPIKDHFLWICHRSDFGEDPCDEERLSAVDARLEALQSAVQNQQAATDQRLHALDRRVHDFGDSLDSSRRSLEQIVTRVDAMDRTMQESMRQMLELQQTLADQVARSLAASSSS